MSEEIQSTEINEDNIAKVLSGELDYESLTEAELEIAADRQLAEEQGSTEEEITTEIEQPEVAETPKEETADTEENSNIIPLNQDERLRDTLAENNRLNQLLKDREDRIEKAKADPKLAEKLLGLKAEVSVDPERDYLADENLARMESELSELKQWREDREQGDRARDADVAHTQEKLNVFCEINSLQASNPSLKTSKPFQSIDETFRNWQETAMGSNVDVDKFLEDKAYRKQAEDAGHTLNVSDADLDVAIKLWDINSKYNAEKKQGFSTSLKHVFTKSPMYEQSMRAKYSQHTDSDDSAIASKLREREAEVTIMSPGSNLGGADPKECELALTEQQALSMKAHLTPADNKRWNELDKIIDKYI